MTIYNTNWYLESMNTLIRNDGGKEGMKRETYEGGWENEGKERPLDVRICTRCQWVRQNEQMEEPPRGEWCEGCLNESPLA